jgi:hypothetical protein
MQEPSGDDCSHDRVSIRDGGQGRAWCQQHRPRPAFSTEAVGAASRSGGELANDVRTQDTAIDRELVNPSLAKLHKGEKVLTAHEVVRTRRR